MNDSPPPSLRAAHVLVVGVGGIGCPAAIALREAGVGQLTLIDPDVVELSNLPRQVLFSHDDLGRPKAEVAAERLEEIAGPPGSSVRCVRARCDDTNAEALLVGVDVLLDATDGALTKDWLNQLAVRSGLPLVHAAALRSEARLLTVPAGGRPCLACLFGRLHEELGSCADLGVWNGVVGSIGFLAAEAVLRLLEDPASVRPGYAVLDFESGRSMTLGAAADPACPVCRHEAAVEPYPVVLGCGPSEQGRTSADQLDLSQERCPLNLLRARRALAGLASGAVLELLLGEEGRETVPDGVRALGHEVLQTEALPGGLRLRVRASGADEQTQLDDETLRRNARQIVLPEFGERGQLRLQQASVVLLGHGPARDMARTYLLASGVGTLLLPSGDGLADEVPPGAIVAWAGGAPVPAAWRSRAPAALVLARREAGCRVEAGWQDARGSDGAADALARAYGTLLADAVQRQLVLEERPECSLSLPLGQDRGG